MGPPGLSGTARSLVRWPASFALGMIDLLMLLAGLVARRSLAC